jgi:hypothetical protein
MTTNKQRKGAGLKSGPGSESGSGPDHTDGTGAGKGSRANISSERPPLFKRWRGWYLFVLLDLAVLILLFYLFTKHYD